MRLATTTMGRGRELVLVHGWGMNGAVWADLASWLANGFRVTVLELPGHGRSPFDPMCTTLDAWVDACLAATPARAVWIGWSLGGTLALRAALQAPARVTSLAMVTATPRFVRDSDWPHAMAVATLMQFRAQLLADPGATLARFLALQVRGSEVARETLRTLKDRLRARPAPVAGALEAGLELLRRTDLRRHLAALRCRTLWMLGGRDTLVPPAVASELRQYLPDAAVATIPGAGHAPFLSHWEQAAGCLKDFLEGSDT